MTPAPTIMTSRVRQLTSVSRSPFRRHGDGGFRCRQSHLAAAPGIMSPCRLTGRGERERVLFAIFSLFKIPEKDFFFGQTVAEVGESFLFSYRIRRLR
jgi:hypothetical protein